MLSAQPCYPHDKAFITSCSLLYLLSELTAVEAALLQARQWHAVCGAELALLRTRRQLVAPWSQWWPQKPLSILLPLVI
jgi:hypothetical protein